MIARLSTTNVGAVVSVYGNIDEELFDVISGVQVLTKRSMLKITDTRRGATK